MSKHKTLKWMDLQGAKFSGAVVPLCDPSRAHQTLVEIFLSRMERQARVKVGDPKKYFPGGTKN